MRAECLCPARVCKDLFEDDRATPDEVRVREKTKPVCSKLRLKTPARSSRNGKKLRRTGCDGGRVQRMSRAWIRAVDVVVYRSATLGTSDDRSATVIETTTTYR